MQITPQPFNKRLANTSSPPNTKHTLYLFMHFSFWASNTKQCRIHFSRQKYKSIIFSIPYIDWWRRLFTVCIYLDTWWLAISTLGLALFFSLAPLSLLFWDFSSFVLENSHIPSIDTDIRVRANSELFNQLRILLVKIQYYAKTLRSTMDLKRLNGFPRNIDRL